MLDVIGDLVPTALAGILANASSQISPGGADPWTDAPRPLQGTIRPGTGFHGSGRIALTWPDGAIQNKWLRVTINPIPPIGFPGDTFVFGNLVADAGDSAASFAVDGADVLSTRAALGARGVAITAAHDFNRDGVVNAADYAVARRALGAGLSAPPVAAAQGVITAPAARRRPITRSVLDGTTASLVPR